MASINEKYALCIAERKNPRYRVFCFPWAGGGTGSYARWHKYLPKHIEIHGVRLAGRETRENEPAFTTMQPLIKDLALGLLTTLLERPFIFYGHSFGATVAFDLSRYLKEKYYIEPEHLVVSGTFGPFSPLRMTHRNEDWSWTWADDEGFIAGMRKLGGTSSDIQDDYAMKDVIPVMRDDFKIFNKYGEDPQPPEPYLNCPIAHFSGEDDREHPPEEWAAATSSQEFHSEVVRGGHFFMLEDKNTRKICEFIAKRYS